MQNCSKKKSEKSNKFEEKPIHKKTNISTRTILLIWASLLIFMYAASIMTKIENSGNLNNIPNGLIKAICEFIYIWTFEQWFWSLLGLIFLYIFATYVHNKYVAPKIGLYITKLMTIYLISFDLLFNFILGIWAMYYRNTIFGQFMVQCPVAISPFIFAFEILIMTILFLIKSRYKTSSNTHMNK